MEKEERTVLANSGFGERAYTKSEFINSWMSPVYDTTTLLLSSTDKAELKIAEILAETGKRLAAAKFEKLYAEQTKKNETASDDLDPSADGLLTDEN